MNDAASVRERYEDVLKKIKDAAEKAGRDPDEVTLVAVSKTKPIELMEEAAALGQLDFGENHVQEVVWKQALHPEYRFHMIGHLQTNKVKQVVGKAVLIHSVDSVHLAKTISDVSVRRGLVSDVLLEINVASEPQKYGFPPEEAAGAAREIAAFPGIRIRGLMCVAPNSDDPEKNRPYFQKMQHLAVDIGQKNIDNVFMTVLSMGMSKDFAVAVEEGATIVRVGTALFGEREYKGA